MRVLKKDYVEDPDIVRDAIRNREVIELISESGEVVGKIHCPGLPEDEILVMKRPAWRALAYLAIASVGSGEKDLKLYARASKMMDEGNDVGACELIAEFYADSF